MACKVSSGGMLGRLFRMEPQVTRASIACRDLAQSLDARCSSSSASETVRGCLHGVSTLLDSPTSSAAERTEVVKTLLHADLPLKMLEALPSLEFEATKDIMRLFNQMLKSGTLPVLDYISGHKEILQMLLSGCGNPAVALQSNMMLRTCAQHAKLVELLLEAGFIEGLIELVQQPDFDISSDAFSSLRELLLTSTQVSASYIADRADFFFNAYHKLLQSEDYFTKRQALRLLADILLDTHFAAAAQSYAQNVNFLKLQMNLLLDNSKSIQGDAFQILSVFAANIQNSSRVHKIMFNNKDRLIMLSESMGADCKDDDDELAADLQTLRENLEALAAPMRTRTQSEVSDRSSSPGTPPLELESSHKQVVLDQCSSSYPTACNVFILSNGYAMF